MLLRMDTVLDHGRILEVYYKNGKLRAVKGMGAKVEQLEMNMVRVTTLKYGVQYLELGPHVRWLKEEA